MDYNWPDSSVHGISQARILEWVATSFSWGSSQHRDLFHLGLLCFLHWPVDPLPVSHLGSPLNHSYVLVIPGTSHTYCFPSNLPASGSSFPRYLCDYFTLFETSLKNLSLSPHLYYLLAFNTGHVLIYLIYCQLPQLEHNSHEVCFSFPLIFQGLNKFWTNSTNLSCLEREH